MSSKELICDLFNLSKAETIFEDFACALGKSNIMHHGRLFVSENFICFYANVMGFKTKKVIEVKDITNLDKKASFGFVPNSIEIISSSNKPLKFTSFADRNSAFKLIYAIWKGTPYERNDSIENKEEITPNEQLEEGEIETGEINFLEINTVNEKEIKRISLPIAVSKFFELFISDNAAFSIADHFQMKGEHEISLTKWDFDQELGMCTRELKMIINLFDVPLRDKSRSYKVQSYKFENDVLIINSTTKTLDVPYNSYFQVEEKWEIKPQENSTDKCVCVQYGWVAFNKSTYFRRKIEDRTIEGLRQDYELWVKNIKEKKILEGGEKPMKKCEENSHEFEKSKTLELGENIIRKKSEAGKFIKNSQSMDDDQGIQSVSKIMKIYTIFLLAIVLILLLTIVLVQSNHGIMLERIKSIENSLINKKNDL